MREYLESTEIVDWEHPAVGFLARQLAQDSSDSLSIAKRCFEWVRDEIAHSSDHCRNPVTCSASEVLRHGTGFCYAKSHLLAALLRANGIPAGFVYQRLSLDGSGPPFCLHGLIALHLPSFEWYRVDARGDRPGIETELRPPEERLAFQPRLPGEATFAEIWPAPLPVVIDALRGFDTYDAMLKNLPDVDHSEMARTQPQPMVMLSGPSMRLWRAMAG
jgi:transglutaminase-like putative cysteine protease